MAERRTQARPAADAGGANGDASGARAAPREDPWTGQVAVTPADREALEQVGDAFVSGVGAIVRDWVARLRADPDIPDARVRTEAELEDHAATFVTDVGLALRTLADPTDEPGLLRDGTAILGVIAERHGAQRARLGWPAAALAREFALLGEVLDAAARGAAGAGAERARVVVAHLVAQAERVSLGGLRVADASGGAPGGGV
jgi:hypothetical protein